MMSRVATHSAPTAMLASNGLHIVHPGATRDAVRDFYLALHRGEILVIAGPNGSGKSSLLAALGRELTPRVGQVTDRDGTELARIPRRAWARRVARLPQEPRCPSGMTVEELVASGRHPHRSLLGSLDRADRTAVQEALSWTDVCHLRSRRVETLSGGERRRAWLAMTLAQGADVLLLDEPMSGLDLGHRFEVEELLVRLARSRELTLAVVIHDLAAAVRIADRLAVMHAGRLYCCAPPAEALSPETLADVFGLEAAIERRADGRPALHVEGPARIRRFL